MMKARYLARLIAFYLPQYYPIPENDRWWGKGFTEWTNVAKAKPLFTGHYQPHIPADLGFYDLRVPETRAAQAEMARSCGIEGFCYWHYWFGHGKRILTLPFEEVLRTGEPDFPFCLCWANASWTGVWYGAPDRILVEQTYPGQGDYEAHFYAVLDALADDRYITIEGKPVFLVFRPLELPEPRFFTDLWRELALKSGLKGLFLLGVLSGGWKTWVPEDHGFDGAVLNNLQPAFGWLDEPGNWYVERLAIALTKQSAKELYRKIFRRPKVITYRRAIDLALTSLSEKWLQFPGVMPNWDNTPRSGADGTVFHGSTPELFRRHLRQAVAQVIDRDLDRRVVIIKSWNEWAEGNHLEPDLRFGKGYLEVIRDEASA
jgi:lipopolysaccharide biosynthesis protein